MRATVKNSDFSMELEKILTKYGDDVIEATRQVVKKNATQAKDYLRNISPRKTGKFAESWAIHQESSALNAHATVYQAKKPGLAHLLEHGHANRGGGRTEGRHFMALVEEVTKKDFEDDLEAVLSNV